MTKTCTKCQVEKPLGEFYKNKNSKDGLFSQCKNCQNLAKQQWRKNNPEKRAAMRRAYYQKYPEKRAEERRRYRQRYPERKAEERRRWRKNQPAAIYKITNKQTGVFYIGCSTQIKTRWGKHRRELKQDKHRNRLLQEAYNEYGLDAFEFEIIKEYPADTPFEVLEKEETRLILENHSKGVPMYNLSIKINSIDENLLTK